MVFPPGLMLTTISLLACAVALGQPAEAWQLQPRLARGQEFVYRGSFKQEASNQGVAFSQNFRVEARIFVVDTAGPVADVAFFTVLRSSTSSKQDAASSVRLEMARVDGQGKVTGSHPDALRVPLDGPATVECGPIVEVPRGSLGLDQQWETGEKGRPVHAWRVAGVESVNGSRCVKLAGVEKSPEWDQPRADRAAWRRLDTVWVAPRTGIVYRMERIIERREPGRREAQDRTITRCELESNLQYPGQLCEDRRREIALASSQAASLQSLLPRSGSVGPKPFESILARIQYHIEHEPPTPYRAALAPLQQLAEAGKRNDPPLVTAQAEGTPLIQVARTGSVAPDFLATDLVTSQTVRLKSLEGKPVLLIFFSPTSPTLEETMYFASSVSRAHPEAAVLALSIASDAEPALALRKRLGLKVPFLAGAGVRLSFAVEATPQFVLIDSKGIVRGSFTGWGPEVPESIESELKKDGGHAAKNEEPRIQSAE